MKKSKLIRFIPLILAVIAIFALTAQNRTDTTALSHAFKDFLVSICDRAGIDVSDRWWNDNNSVRVLGHVIEYFILGLTAGIAFEKKWKGLLLCMAVSLLDQITKIFVPIRHFDIRDIPFDIIGYGSALLIVTVISIAVKAIRSDETPRGSET